MSTAITISINQQAFARLNHYCQVNDIEFSEAICTHLPTIIDDDVTATTPHKTAYLIRGNNPTDEQFNAVDTAVCGNSLKIQAFAGSGKTSVLSSISYYMAKKTRGFYLAFNNKMASDVRPKLTKNFIAQTAHSIAFQEVGRYYANRLNKEITPHLLGTKFLGLHKGLGSLSIAASSTLVMNTVSNFCTSTALEINDQHIPSYALQPLAESESGAVKAQCLALANTLWQQMNDKNHSCPVTHDAYFKAWALDDPTIGADIILFDEAQDMSGLLIDIIQKQQCQKVFAGDRYQQIYSWRGASNALDIITDIRACTLTQSFRFGENIADVANYILNEHLDAKVELKGNRYIKSSVGAVEQPNAVICRTIHAMINELYRCCNLGQKPLMTGDQSALLTFATAVEEINGKGRTNYLPLAAFSTWNEVVTFAESDKGKHIRSKVNIIKQYNAKSLLRLFDSIKDNTEQNANVILINPHKCKGLEYASVRLGGGFKSPVNNRRYAAEEGNLLYVAATRATTSLDISSCDALSGFGV